MRRHAVVRTGWLDGRWFGRGRTRALLSLGMLVGFGSVGTLASWTASESTNPGSVRTGELHVDLGSNVGVKPEAYTWTSLAATGLHPGGSVAAAVVPVGNNSGPRLGLEYTLSARVTNTSASVADTGIAVTVRSGATVAGTACTGGTELVTEQRLTGVLTSLPMAPQPIDPMTAGELCFQVTMAQDAPNNVQGTTSRIVLRFEARSVSP